MKKSFALLTVLCMMLCGCNEHNVMKANTQDGTAAIENSSVAEVTEEANETKLQRSWQEIYAEKIRERQATAEYPDSMHYDLIYIDEDDVPELYVAEGINYSAVYTIIGGSIAELHPNSYYRDKGFKSYAEHQGIYYTSSNGGIAAGSIEIWHVENGVSKMIDVYHWNTTDDFTEMHYFLNDIPITRDRFDAMLAKKSAGSQGAFPVSFVEIMREIGFTPETEHLINEWLFPPDSSHTTYSGDITRIACSIP